MSREYSEAAFAYSRGDKRGALARLESLLNSKTLTSSDRAFLSCQRDICLTALGERGAAQDTSPRSQRPHDPTTQRPALADCGPRALAIAALSLGVKTDAKRLAIASGTTRYGTTLDGLAKAARTIALGAEGVQVDGNALKQLDTPAISRVDGDHFLVVLKVDGDQATVHDPNQPKEETMETAELLRRSGGILLKLRLMCEFRQLITSRSRTRFGGSGRMERTNLPLPN